MRIGELAQAAGVSARTIRYYIVEGLLPPPDGAGLGASYDQTHLDRLRLIRHLKDTYLPLREIRRRLTGLDDAAVRARLAEIDREPPTSTSTRNTDSTEGSLRRLASRPPPASDHIAAQAPTPEPGHPGDPQPGPAPVPPEYPGTPQPEPDTPGYPGYPLPESSSGLTVGVATPPPPDAPSTKAAAPDAESWIRLKLGDDVELLVRSGAYHRLRDRIDWLAGWARAIFR